MCVKTALLLVSILFCATQNFVQATIPLNLACGGTSMYKWLNLLQSSSTPCSYYIAPYNYLVCQLKIEFSTNLAQPTATTPDNNARCTNNYIRIGRFDICGINSNQHLYVDFDGSNLNNRFVVTTNPGSGTFSIKVTQVVCPPGTRATFNQLRTDVEKSSNAVLGKLISPLTIYDTDILAPRGCDQFFTASQGIIDSFNWNNRQGPYIGETQYTVCFKTPLAATRFQLYGLDFRLGSNPGAMTDDNCYDLYGATPGITSDYIFLPNSKIVGGTATADYYCGDILEGKSVESTSLFSTYSFTFKAGKYSSGNYPQRAFKFQYYVL